MFSLTYELELFSFSRRLFNCLLFLFLTMSSHPRHREFREAGTANHLAMNFIFDDIPSHAPTVFSTFLFVPIRDHLSHIFNTVDITRCSSLSLV